MINVKFREEQLQHNCDFYVKWTKTQGIIFRVGVEIKSLIITKYLKFRENLLFFALLCQSNFSLKN